ncbi:EAL domain-containing protein [Emcibacter sp.]|uniref:EAL domain-containing protein n=1 Tax=Emcibacter sp. TaxID=1979954 RepID=UPI002AA953A1|nr:EAL domain-containing protein [Emcibacter sp.]
MNGDILPINKKTAASAAGDIQFLLEGLPQGVAFFDHALRLETWNKKFLNILDTPENFLRQARCLRDFLSLTVSESPDHANSISSRIIDEMKQADLAGDLFPVSFEQLLPSGKYIEVRGEPVPGAGYSLTLTDITARKEAEGSKHDNLREMSDQLEEIRGDRHTVEQQASDALQLAEELALAQNEAEESARRIQAILDAMADGLLTVDRNACIVTANHAVEEMFGYSLDEIVGQSLLFLLNSTFFMDQEGLVSYFDSIEKDKKEYKRKETGYRKNGTHFPIELSIREVEFSDQRQFTVLVRDVSERFEAETLIRKMAMHDSLTGLANRNLLQQRLDEALKMAKRLGRKVSVMFLDLDMFKPVNDLYGHGTGDKLLRIVAERLTECAREVDTVARLGGDEFAIVFTNLDDESVVTRIAKRILDSIQKPIEIDDKIHQVGTSIGISFFPHDSRNPDELIRMADVALYQAKDNGRRLYRIYDSQMDASAKAEKEIEMDLSRAIENNEMSLHFQPQLDTIDNSIVGAEALVRWHHPVRGTVPPYHFIPIAEHCGEIIPIGQWIMETACRQAREWQEKGLPSFRVCVNISAKQFHLRDFTEKVEEALEESGLAPQWLELEITEGMVIADQDSIIPKLEKLASLGVTLAIDDFGTGYSSLAYLKKFSVHQLKIDQSFIRDITEDHDDAAITDAVIRLGHSLGLTVVAEGVETEEHVQLLRQKGCDVLQGYHFSEPLPSEQFEEWVHAHINRVTD